MFFALDPKYVSNALKYKKFDVRPILARGEEPFPEIRKRIDALKPGEGLQLVAPFLPSPLVERLRGEGFESTIERGKSGEWIVYFHRAGEHA